MPKNAFWNVHPRYSSGSPASLRNKCLVGRVVDSERQNYKAALEGMYGDEHKIRAERLGLRGIIVLMHEKRNHWACYDEITNQSYELPFRNRMKKNGFVRWADIDIFVQDLIAKCEPIIVQEVKKDSRSFWFNNTISEIDFVRGKGTWDNPIVPKNLLWEPTIKIETESQQLVSD